MLNNLKKLWNDDAGSVIATEYLALAGIVALGGVAGLDAVRSATVDESKEVAAGIRSMNQTYRINGKSTAGASAAGSAATDTTNANYNSNSNTNSNTNMNSNGNSNFGRSTP